MITNKFELNGTIFTVKRYGRDFVNGARRYDEVMVQEPGKSYQLKYLPIRPIPLGVVSGLAPVQYQKFRIEPDGTEILLEEASFESTTQPGASFEMLFDLVSSLSYGEITKQMILNGLCINFFGFYLFAPDGTFILPDGAIEILI